MSRSGRVVAVAGVAVFGLVSTTGVAEVGAAPAPPKFKYHLAMGDSYTAMPLVPPGRRRKGLASVPSACTSAGGGNRRRSRVSTAPLWWRRSCSSPTRTCVSGSLAVGTRATGEAWGVVVLDAVDEACLYGIDH